MGTSRSGAELAGKLTRYATTIPRANREGVDRAAWFAKGEFDAGLRAAGSSSGGKLRTPGKGGQRLGARYDIQGYQNATARVRYTGPVHLLFRPTKKHLIAAKHLGTRRGIAAKTAQIGANAAFGGSNRGAFGKLQKTANYNRYGSVRQQAGKGLRQRAGKQALVFGGSKGPKAYAFHPGTRGRNAWPVVKNRVARGAPKVWAQAHRNSLIDAFR